MRNILTKGTGKGVVLNRTLYKWYIILLPCFFTYTSAEGQKLENIQKTSLKAPANIKIDGKATEWNNEFQAFNKSANIYYSIANNDNNIYLVIQSKDNLISKKILRGGITFSFSKTGKKDKNNTLTLTFPLLSEKTASGISYYINQSASMKKGQPNRSSKNDSLTLLMNKQLTDNLKEIEIKGSRLLEDSIISVYNNKGIKASALFESPATLTYELALPLKYLTASGNGSNKIYYNIKLNGIFSRVKVVMLDSNVPPNTTMTIVGSSVSGKTQADNQVLNSNTDFWGEYNLNKL